MTSSSLASSLSIRSSMFASVPGPTHPRAISSIASRKRITGWVSSSWGSHSLPLGQGSPLQVSMQSTSSDLDTGGFSLAISTPPWTGSSLGRSGLESPSNSPSLMRLSHVSMVVTRRFVKNSFRSASSLGISNCLPSASVGHNGLIVPSAYFCLLNFSPLKSAK